jgi:hypothetical protein
MKPYLVFHGLGCVPIVAVRYLLGSFETLLEAEQFSEYQLRSDSGNWAQVCDRDSWQVLRSGIQDGAVSAYWWEWRDSPSRVAGASLERGAEMDKGNDTARIASGHGTLQRH